MTGLGRALGTIGLMVALGTAQPLLAQEFECLSAGSQRFIRVEFPGLEHLCEVSVTSENEGRRVMWYANNDTLFCTDKAYELRDKYIDKWGFRCEQWPDRDGIDGLSVRHRNILDARLKSLRTESAALNEQVVSVKAVASTELDALPGNLAFQFFLANINTGVTRDVTDIIQDSGTDWTVLTQVGQLTDYIDPVDGLRISTALISTITDNGALEITTLMDSTGAEAIHGSDCYGEQVFYANTEGALVPHSPHRLVCTGRDDAAQSSDGAAGAG